MKMRNIKGHLITLAVAFLAIFLNDKFDPFGLNKGK